MCTISYIRAIVNAVFCRKTTYLAENPAAEGAHERIYAVTVSTNSAYIILYSCTVEHEQNNIATEACVMQDDIFNLLMMILMLENGGGTESINQLVIMFLLMNSRDGNNSGIGLNSFNRRCRSDCCDRNCNRDDGFTF